MCRLDELKGRLDEIEREAADLHADFDCLRESIRAPVIVLPSTEADTPT